MGPLRILLALLLVTQAGPGKPQATASVVKGPAGTQVDEYLTRSVPFGFSGSVLIAKDEKLLVCKGYGLADRKTGSACTPDTIFDIGSLSEQFTASLVLVLEQRGVLKVTDTLGQFIKDVPEDKREIQIQHLLAHTSGLARELATTLSDGEEWHFDIRHDLPTAPVEIREREALIRAVLSTPLEFRPGEKHGQSNIGYELLAAVAEIAAKKPFDEMLREFLFEPAGLEHTGTRRDGLLDASFAARGCPVPDEPPPEGSILEYDANRFDGQGEEKLLATDGWYSWGLRGAGGVLTSVADLWKWEQMLRGDSILSAASRKKLFTPPVGNSAYAWYGGDPPRVVGAMDEGDITGNGFDAWIGRSPKQHLFIAMLGNVPGVVWPLHFTIERMVPFGKVNPPPATIRLTDEQLQAWCGTYIGPQGEEFRIRAFGPELLVEAWSEGAFKFFGPGGSTGPDIRRVVEPSRKLVAGFAHADFKALHEAERALHPVTFMEECWSRLIDHHGPLLSAEVLGVGVDGMGLCVPVALQFERGCEILQLHWSTDRNPMEKDWLSTVSLAPPYESRLHFATESATSAVAGNNYGRFDFHMTLATREQGATLDFEGFGRHLILSQVLPHPTFRSR